MPDFVNDAHRREQLRIAAAKARAKRKEAGLPAHSGPSGGQSTGAKRARRYRERQKALALEQVKRPVDLSGQDD